MNVETWMPVAGYEGLYEVSDGGRVRSLARKNCRGRVLKYRVDSAGEGYVYVTLCRDGVNKKVNVHQLVLAAFVGEPNGLWGLHRNGDKGDSRLANLYYGTPKQNSGDMVQHGRSQRGTKHYKAVLTPELVAWVRESHQSSLEIARQLGVAGSTIRAARLRHNWAHV